MPSDTASIRFDVQDCRPCVRQRANARLLGIVFWLAGAMMIRFAHHAEIDTGVWRAGLFTIVVPLTWLAIRRLRRAVRAEAPQVPGLVAISTGTAALCDAVALTWFPQIYAADEQGVASATIFLFWGIAVALALAFSPVRRPA